MIIFLLNFSLVFSLEVESCKSNNDNWECEEDEICVCKIDGTCTDGVLLVYDDDISDMLCMPEIKSKKAEFTWDSCGNPIGEVKVRADCDEGQSDEEDLEVIEFYIDRTTTTTVITTTRRTTTTGVATTIDGLEPCPDEYECCEDEYPYEDMRCPIGEECCPDHVCREDCYQDGGPGGPNYWLVFGIIIVIIAVFLVYFFFIKKRGKMSFKKLYEKWT